MTTTWIQPYEQVILYEIDHITISITSLELGVKAGITTNFYDRHNELRRQEFAIMEGEDYQKWTTDEYVVKWVCTKYGLVEINSN